jgi:hypothetical protein
LGEKNLSIRPNKFSWEIGLFYKRDFFIGEGDNRGGFKDFTAPGFSREKTKEFLITNLKVFMASKKRKPGKYLKFYYEFIKNPAESLSVRVNHDNYCHEGQLVGLCSMFRTEIDYFAELELNDLFEPKRYKMPWWASGSSSPKLGEFTPLRQNIVLLMAAMNNEL